MGGIGEEKSSAEGEEYKKNGKKEKEEEDDDQKKGEKDQVVKSKFVVKMSKMKEALERHQFSESESQSSKSQDGVISAPPPLNQPNTDFDLTQVEPALKKLRTWVEENCSKPPPTASDRPPARSDVINFGPFSPTKDTAAPKKRHRLKIIGPRPPKPKRLLEPPRVTYLRPKPGPACDPDDPNTPMGPPPEPRELTTPYETVKNALTILKKELGIFMLRSQSPEPEETQLTLTKAELEELTDYEIAQIDNAATPEYSLSRVTPGSLFSVEEVVMELDLYLKSIPETASSNEMKAKLLQFQIRLGLPTPPHPLFYNLIWQSPTDFKNYLAERNFVYDDNDDDDGNDEDRGGNAVAVSNVGDEAGGDKVEVVDDSANEEDAKAVAGPYDHLPLPALPFHDANRIMHEFANRIQDNKDFKVNEDAFLNLQRDLQLPEWIGLYELYQSESMLEVIHFIVNYFQTHRRYQATSKKPH